MYCLERRLDEKNKSTFLWIGYRLIPKQKWSVFVRENKNVYGAGMGELFASNVKYD